MAGNDWRRVREAYGQAWKHRVASEVGSHDSLLDALSANGLGELTAPGPVRDLLIGAWDDAVEPRHLHRAWLRSAVEQAGTVVAVLVPLARQILQQLADGEEADMSWRDPPQGHRMLSQVRRSNDLALRWFFPRATQAVLAFTPEPTAAEFLTDKLWGLAGSDDDDWDVPVWLRTRSNPGETEVIAGNLLVGTTQVTAKVGDALATEATRGVYSDGRLALASMAPDVFVLTCWLPETALRD